MTRILIVEDEESYREPLVYQLTREGYDVSAAATGEEGLELFTKGGIDLVLLDLMLPGLDGTALCRRIREQSRVPIIMLTAKSAEIDKVVGLEIGADDYITKPYSFRELLARVRAVLRRNQMVADATESSDDDIPLICGDISMKIGQHEVMVRGENVFFPLKEFELLEYLMQIVEDEESYREPLVYQLTREGYDVSAAATGEEGLELFTKGGIDLVLLDLMLPGLDGTALCRRIREQSRVPIIMLTAKSAEIDKVVGLEIGADDYITKPYSFRELLARVRAVLRRNQMVADATESSDDDIPLICGDISMKIGQHEVMVRGENVFFPLKEFELLEYLMQNKGRVMTRHQLIDRIWGSDYVGDTKTLDVHVKRVRSKIEEDPAHPKYLTTVRGLGYKIDVPAE